MQGKVPAEPQRKGKVPEERAAPDMREDEELEGEISQDGWKIMKMLGSARGAFASQVYKELRMSGNAFKNKAELLQDLGVVGMKVGKIRKNKLNYYFLTEMGRKLYSARFGEPIMTSSVKDKDIVENFELGGWKASLKDGIISIEKNRKTLHIVVQKSNDREEITKRLRKYSYFICGSGTIKNIVIQEAARSGKPVLFIATDKEFDEEGKFEKVQFDRI
jgi:hypothetical protein